MKIPLTAIRVAREFFLLAKSENDPHFTAMKLQKLLYYAQAWSQYQKRRDLFAERVKAWKDGPVVPEVYHEFKGQRFISFDNPKLNQPSDLSPEEKLLVHSVWQLYGHLTGDQLSDMTHQESAFLSARKTAIPFVHPSPAINAQFMRKDVEKYVSENTERFESYVANNNASPL